MLLLPTKKDLSTIVKKTELNEAALTDKRHKNSAAKKSDNDLPNLDVELKDFNCDTQSQ